MNTCPRYGRITVEVKLAVDFVTAHTPDGSEERVPVYTDCPAELYLDDHGYEPLPRPTGAPRRCFRYTPCEIGKYRFTADGKTVYELECTPSDNHGYIGVSKTDSRYFAFTDGTCFVPIGPNTCILRYDALPSGSNAHFETGGGFATQGIGHYRRWFKELKKAGVNYTRLWLSSVYFETRTPHMGKHNLEKFARLDAVVEMAREYGIYIKFCMESFRYFVPEPDPNPAFTFGKYIIDERTGKPHCPENGSVQEWLTEPYWNQKWLEDMKPFVDRYHDDPVVFAWELWNEMNCLAADFNDVLDFTDRMCGWFKEQSPRNMSANSTGSFDTASYEEPFTGMSKLKNMPFSPFHRYIDQGAPLEICHYTPIDMIVDGTKRFTVPGKPTVLNETGAVNDRHTSIFRFYCCDNDGMILTDVTYAPFFAGCGASGHSWHWESYIEQKNLWHVYEPLVRLLDGVEADKEGFETIDETRDGARILGLRGKTCTLYYIRNDADRWAATLRDRIEPAEITGLTIDGGSAFCMGLIGDRIEETVAAENGKITLPAFHRGMVVKVTP